MRLTITALLAALLATPAYADLLLYDGFDYTVGSALPGQTTPVGNALWRGLGTGQHQIVEGNVTYPNMPAQNEGSGSVLVTKEPNNARIAAVPLPLQSGETHYTVNSATGPSLFFSFTMNLTNAVPETGADYFFAGFHFNGDSGGMSSSGGFAAMVHLRPSPTSSGTGADQEYELGISKNNSSGGFNPENPSEETPAFQIEWATDAKFKADSENNLLVVGEYQFVSDPAPNTPIWAESRRDDIARLWVNPTWGDLGAEGTPSAVSTVGADVYASQSGQSFQGSAIRSFYYRTDLNVSGDVIADELRVGTTFADVASTPSQSGDGDFNEDGIVDGADFLMWQRGETNPALSPGSLQDWKDTFGQGAATASTALVPEPSTWALAALAVGALVVRRRLAA